MGDDPSSVPLNLVGIEHSLCALRVGILDHPAWKESPIYGSGSWPIRKPH
jgi:hypothetical protein